MEVNAKEPFCAHTEDRLSDVSCLTSSDRFNQQLHDAEPQAFPVVLLFLASPQTLQIKFLTAQAPSLSIPIPWPSARPPVCSSLAGLLSLLPFLLSFQTKLGCWRNHSKLDLFHLISTSKIVNRCLFFTFELFLLLREHVINSVLSFLVTLQHTPHCWDNVPPSHTSQYSRVQALPYKVPLYTCTCIPTHTCSYLSAIRLPEDHGCR